MQPVSFRNSRIAVHRYGSGDEWLLALHGYGESGSRFAALAQHIGHRYTVIAPDLPLHGDTEWNEPGPFTVHDLYALLETLCPLGARQVSLTGYSMGGRLALALLQHYPAAFNRAVLLAPDGLHRNIWYGLATQTHWGNRLFRFTMQHPGWFMGAVKGAGRAGLLNKSVVRFVNHFLDDANERELLYRRWTFYRHLRPSLPAVVRAFAGRPLLCVYGRYDRIIPPAQARVLRPFPSIQVKQVAAGHQLLHPSTAGHLAGFYLQG